MFISLKIDLKELSMIYIYKDHNFDPNLDKK